MSKAPKLYKVNNQQFIAIDSIEIVDDHGWDIKVTMKGGRSFMINGHERQAFLAIIEALSA